jgi:urease accessory protein
MTKTGKKLAELGADMTDIPLLIRWVSQIRMGSTPGSYPVSLAVLSAASVFSDHPFQKGSRWEEDVLIQETLTMYFYSVAMGLLNASLRVMRITHVDVQRIMYRISSMFEELCRLAQETPLDRMTGYAPMTDILSAVHAGSHVRLFIS